MNNNSTLTMNSNQKSFAHVNRITLVIIMLLFGNATFAQLVYNEGFEANVQPTTTLPLGWAQGKYGAGVDADNYWDRVGVGTFPACLPRTGLGMMRYQSWFITAGEASFLASKRLDMRNNGAGMPGPAPVSLWMWRDNVGFLGNIDRIQVYVNTTPDMSGTPLLLTETATLATDINRSCSLLPVPVTCNAWNQYFYNIPNVAPYINSADVYVIILGISAFGNNMFIDDFSVTSYPSNQTYLAAPAPGVVQQNTSTTAPNQANQLIIGCRMTMSGALGSSLQTLTEMVFNTNGSTNPPTDIVNAKLWFTGGTNNFSLDNAVLLGIYTPPHATNDTFIIASPFLTSSSPTFSALDHGDNYFWLTYNVAPGAISGNCLDAEWLSFRTNGTVRTPNPQTLPGCRLIDVIYCVPSYAVGTSWAGYQTNDYVHNVVMAGDVALPPGISNNQNWISAFAGPLCPAPFPRNCPFQSHPPDYELFAEVSGKTASLTANNTTNYPISLQVGTYGSGNAIAAWIDYNKDGVFNNWFVTININCTGIINQNTITLVGVTTTHPGWRVGMTVTGGGVAPGATITNVVGTTVTLSANNIATFGSTSINFATPDGEKISQSQGMGALGTYVTTFRVPTTATAGKTRMRVREVWIRYNIDPCLTYTYGETEDYRITVIPDCPTYPGYTTWLGLTSNWADPSNWCPAVAPINGNPVVNVRLPGGPSGVYPYVRPVITANVQAVTSKLRIEANDTLYIDATTNSYLTINDSLKIWTPTSALKINTTYLDTAQVFNGTLNRPADSPLSSTKRARSFIAIPNADLVLQGLQTGDVITNILIHLQRKSTGAPYKNLTVKYFYTTNAQALFGVGFTAAVPLPTGAPAAPVTIFGPADVNAATFVPISDNYGTIDLALTTPFAWSGTANPLIIEICYDNEGFAGTGFNDEVRFTQTTSLRRYMNLEALSAFPMAGCNLSPKDTVRVNAAGTVGTNTFTVDLAHFPKMFVGQLITSANIPGLQVTAVTAPNVITLSGNATGAPGPWSATGAGQLTVYNTNNTSITFRPNLTFKYTRPYIKYPLTARGHWENNGLFVPAISLTSFTGTTLQRILGSSVTEFHEYTLNNNQHVELNQDILINDTLTLQNGRLKLNNRLATLTYDAPSALLRTNGFIQSDHDLIASNVAPFGRLRWNMGSTLGNRVIPFVNWSGSYIPMDYNPLAGTNDVTIATYATVANNTNLPAPTVTNIFGFNGTAWNSDGSSSADRFYMISNAGVVPRADITFRYATSERSTNNPTGAALMSAQRWLNASSEWEFPFQPAQTYTNGTPDQLQVANFTNFSTNNWWVIVGNSTPLPVTLLDFAAVPYKDKVELRWTTGSEINNSHFEIDRTVNNEDFTFIGRVNSKGPSNNRVDYSLWDMNPVQGIQYYYLRQHDFDGKSERFGPVSAKFSSDLFDIVTTSISSSELGLTVVFNYDTDEPFSYRIVDMLGRVLVSKDKNPGEPGVNVIEIDTQFSKGAYQIVLQNSEKVVSRKFIY